MSSASNQPQQGFPAVPQSLNAGDYTGAYDTDKNVSEHHNTVPYLTPYLGLRARLSQVWINRWTVLLLLIICRLLLAVSSINKDIASAKTEALSACTTVENVGSAMASMPHYLATGVNALAADGITKAMSGLMDMLTLSVTGVEEIVLFVINMMTSTYVCLITLAVSGALEVAIEMIEKVGNFMNQTIGNITSGIKTDVTSFQNDLNSFLKDVSIPAGLLGGSTSVPTINITGKLDSLSDITIDPTTMDADLTKLNASIPSFADVQNFTNGVISTPFEMLKTLINGSIANYTFDQSVFPVPQKQSLEFCSNNSTLENFFEDLVKAIYAARIIFLVVLIIAAVLACLPMAWLEIRRWRSLKQRSVLLQKHAFDPIDVVYIASRPYTTSAGIKLSSRFKGTRRQILARWFVAYATSLPALFLLALGMAGLFSCLCQLIILKAIEKEIPVLAQEVGDFAADVVKALNDSSTAWATDANSLINSTNVKLNDDVFGWVNTSTSAVNDTLNWFTVKMNDELNSTFGGTILYEPIQGVMNCLVELKIAGIQKGLTWVSDHAHITFPEFRSDVFSLGAAASLTNSSADSSFLANPASVTSDDITSAVAKVTNALQEGIRQEAIIAGCIVFLWVILMLMGLGRVIYAGMGRDKTRAEGGPVGYNTGDNIALSPQVQRPVNESMFPAFRGPVRQDNPFGDDKAFYQETSFTDEKMGEVESRNVEMKSGHERASSYGFVEKQ